MKALLGLALAMSLAAPAMAAVSLTVPADGQSPIVRVEGGCGRDGHRGEDGRCHPNFREWDGRRCPRGYHLGREDRRCWPN